MLKNMLASSVDVIANQEASEIQKGLRRCDAVLTGCEYELSQVVQKSLNPEGVSKVLEGLRSVSVNASSEISFSK